MEVGTTLQLLNFRTFLPATFVIALPLRFIVVAIAVFVAFAGLFVA